MDSQLLNRFVARRRRRDQGTMCFSVRICHNCADENLTVYDATHQIECPLCNNTIEKGMSLCFRHYCHECFKEHDYPVFRTVDVLYHSYCHDCMKPLRGQTIPNSHEPKGKKRTKTIGERCNGRIKSGRRCKLSAIDDGYCSTHQYQKEIQDKSSAEEKKEFLEELKSSIPEDDSANLRKLVDDINMITKGIHEIEIGDFKERLSKLGYGLRTQEIAVNIVKSDGIRPFREHRGVLKRNRR